MLPGLDKYNGCNPQGFYMSEKLNGVRALWDGSEFVSKNGRTFAVPIELKNIMPPLQLDGELYADGDLGRIAGLCRRKTSSIYEWQCVTFRVFDAPLYSLNFADRIKYLSGLALPAWCQVVHQTLCDSIEHLRAEYDRIKSAGGEGIVIKSPDNLYRAGRNEKAMKIKYNDDFELNGVTIDNLGHFICIRDYE